MWIFEFWKQLYSCGFLNSGSSCIQVKFWRFRQKLKSPLILSKL
jgi:hypothetical protein